MKKIVLAYSGGLDTSVIMRWLIEKYRCEVVAFVGDLGQGEDIPGIARKAKETGASKVHVRDLREEFVRDFVWPAVRANAVYEGSYLMGTSLARPVIARHQVLVAREEKAEALAHGATGKGNDQVRFELTARALAPDLKIVAPWREWEFTSRPQLIDYAEKHGIPLPVSKEKPYSTDANLMHVSYEGGILEDPWAEPPTDMFRMTKNAEDAPAKPRVVEIAFKGGDPVAIDGKEASPAALLAEMNAIAGEHGVGRVDLVENRFVGMKSRGVYETPGATVFMAAHRAVESLTMDREVMHLRDGLIPRFAELVYYGFWYSPEMQVLRALLDESQKTVTGTARVKLYKGSCTVLGRKSPNSLYNPEVAGFDTFATYNSKDAEGFIRMNGLRLALNESLRSSADRHV
ncbi:MAG TPA: argininosuccinate synthase [Planctomycetota bacterium]|nr:argininosuccinate synthase [Planctomycetota bacterium]